MFDHDDYECCDVCGKLLDMNKGKDFFVESASGSNVYCEKHWKAVCEVESEGGICLHKKNVNKK